MGQGLETVSCFTRSFGEMTVVELGDVEVSGPIERCTSCSTG